MFFNSWQDILRVIVMGTLSYASLIVILRTSGKRSLSKMNMFDFVITIALGSVFATIILSKDVALAEGIVGLSLLVALQFTVAWLSARFEKFENIVKSEPRLLFCRGQYLDDAMKMERVTAKEVDAAARKQGIGDMSELGAVILETDGTFSVVPNIIPSKNGSLDDIKLAHSV